MEKDIQTLLKSPTLIHFRTCREGCPGGVLTAIDTYLAKSAVQKMVKLFGLGRRLTREKIWRLYEKGGKHHDSKRSCGTIWSAGCRR